MTDSTRDLLKRALELTPLERVRLAQELLGSVAEDEGTELDLAFVAQLRHDSEEFLSGKGEPGIPADEALAGLERRLVERRRAQTG